MCVMGYINNDRLVQVVDKQLQPQDIQVVRVRRSIFANMSDFFIMVLC